jgi:hypothetical protein
VFLERSDEAGDFLVFVRITVVGLSCRVDDAIPEICEVHIVQSLCGYFLVNWSAQLLRGLLDGKFLSQIVFHNGIEGTIVARSKPPAKFGDLIDLGGVVLIAGDNPLDFSGLFLSG